MIEDDLRAWVSNVSVSYSLLSILRPYHPQLPRDKKTLLKTKTSYDTISTPGYRFTIALTQNVKLRNHFLS